MVNLSGYGKIELLQKSRVEQIGVDWTFQVIYSHTLVVLV